MLEQAIETLTLEVRKLREVVQTQNTLLAGRARIPVPAPIVHPPPVLIPKAMPPEQEAMDEKAVARLMGVSVATLRRWRLLKQGPPFRKLGSLVRYRRQDLTEWLDAVPRGAESQ